MRYVLDTNVIIAYLRKQPFWFRMEETFGFFERGTQVVVPSVIVGELRSLGIRNNWGKRRKGELEDLLKQFLPFSELTEEIVQRYAEIDAFSQGRLPGWRLDCSARNMGKNDLWIATLITTDGDFDHLNDRFLNVARFELK